MAEKGSTTSSGLLKRSDNKNVAGRRHGSPPKNNSFIMKVVQNIKTVRLHKISRKENLVWLHF
jgi:hypothetical protein